MTRLVNTLTVYPRAWALVWEVTDPLWGVSGQRGGVWAWSHADLGSNVLASVISDESSISLSLRFRVVVSEPFHCCVGQRRRQVLRLSQAVQRQDGAVVLGGAGVGRVSLSPSGSLEPTSKLDLEEPSQCLLPPGGMWTCLRGVGFSITVMENRSF